MRKTETVRLEAALLGLDTLTLGVVSGIV